MFYRISVFDANSVDPDQMAEPVEFGLGLHCFGAFRD